VAAEVRLESPMPITTLNLAANWRSEIFVATTATDHVFQVLTGTHGSASDQPFHGVVH
jgi:hypothetical protein